MHYYGDINNYLAHHGIKGQKWGVRNGPPYPLNTSSSDRYSKEEVERKRKIVEDLSHELDTEWSYGVLDKKRGRIIEGDGEEGLANYDWKNYRSIPLETLYKEKIGVCWDFVNYQHDRLKKAGIKDESYLVVMDLSTKERERIITHTISTYELGGKNYWLESAMWPKHGIHEIKDFKEACASVASTYTAENKPYSIFKYNPEGLDKGLNDQEMYDRMTEGNWVMDVNVDSKNRK